MPDSKTQRKLVAILFADIVGYTGLMQKDEATARRYLEKFRDTLNEKVAQYGGQVVQYYGDGCICTFDSVVNAMTCAKTTQQIFQTEPQIPVRIGLHSGDVFFEAENVYGDSVNIASRIESLGIGGAVLFSRQIKKHIANQPEFEVESLGVFDFKNVEEPMEVFALANEGLLIPRRKEMKGKVKPAAKSKSRFLIPALLGLLAILGSYYFLNQNKTATPADTSAITIFPFDIKSGNPDIQYLGKGMVDLISTKLEGIPNFDPIDPNRVFNELEKANEEVPALEEAAEISNVLGAAEFILGSIIEINEALQISASKYDSQGRLIAKATSEGQKTQLAPLIDELTRALIADKLKKEGQELNGIAIMTSDNLAALKAYLEGIQAFRKTAFREAATFFETAVSLDSTFALAWFQLHHSKSWIRGPNTTDPRDLEKAVQYADKLPPKWQDLVRAKKLLYTGRPSNRNLFAGLARKYGTHAEFTNLMAEHLFHFNPLHGRSPTEAKPWLERTKELDPQNQEVLKHLSDIAWIESDTAALQKIVAEAPPESQISMYNQVRLLSLQDSVTQAELEEMAAHPAFNMLAVTPTESLRENPTQFLEFLLRFGPYVADEDFFISFFFPSGLAQYRGQEKEVVALLLRRAEKYPLEAGGNFLQWTNAKIIANRDYLPFEEYYQTYLDSLAAYEEPRAYFASAKYAWALGQETPYQANKNKLAAASKQSKGIVNPARYYHWSLAAFEARQLGDNEKALLCIDSAFHYSPSAQNPMKAAAEAAMDKLIMLADIYEEQQNYEKAIQYLENLPEWFIYARVKGYATYRRTQLYEKSGATDEALAKCDLFLKIYKDCDAKYRPWWDEVAERRQRLMARVN